MLSLENCLFLVLELELCARYRKFHTKSKTMPDLSLKEASGPKLVSLKNYDRNNPSSLKFWAVDRPVLEIGKCGLWVKKNFFSIENTRKRQFLAFARFQLKGGERTDTGFPDFKKKLIV